MIEKQALELVEEYVKHHKYRLVRINSKKLTQGQKAPDFEVYKGSDLKFYCEVKTPALNPDPGTGMFHWTTTVSKLRGQVHRAVKQFRDQDPNHTKPWVLFFTSAHFQLNWHKMVHALQGIVNYGQGAVKDLRDQRYVKDTAEDVRVVDLIVWCQVNPEQLRIYQMMHFGNADSALVNGLRVISDNLTPYPHEEIKGLNP